MFLEGSKIVQNICQNDIEMENTHFCHVRKFFFSHNWLTVKHHHFVYILL